MAKDELEEIYSFLPKKGDAIIWHGRLIHRGANPRNNDLTRKSLIGHYCNMFAHEAAVENAPNVFDTTEKSVRTAIALFTTRDAVIEQGP